MKKTRPFLFLITILGLTLLSIGAVARAAPAAQGANLLQNPDFEQPFSNGVAQGWQRWHRDTPRQDEECLVAYHYEPKWVAETNSGFIQSGSTSQLVGNAWDTWSGGVYQTVPATPGTVYRFTFQGRARGSNRQVPDPSETGLQVNMRAGIDPNGSGVWSDADVVWGGAGSPHDTWQPFTVEATASGSQITLFTAADWGITGVNQCRAHLDTWYDAAQLVAQTPPTSVPPTQSPTTQSPAATITVPTATVPAAPTGSVPTEPAAATLAATLEADTPTPTGGSSICANAFLDTKGNGLHEADEGYVAGVTLTVAQGNAIAGQGLSTGSETPLCFGNLGVGTYQVAQTLPPSMEMTTQANATVELGQGQTIGLEFGSRLRATPTVEADASPTGDTVEGEGTVTAAVPTATAPDEGGETAAGGAPGWLVALGLAAILIGITLLGGLLFVVLRR